ncbi:MAG: tyrosine-type recombinase/integrase [Dissulfurispiraceae bacterium]
MKKGKMPETVKKTGHHTFNGLVLEYTKWAERQKSFNSKISFIRELSGLFGNFPLRRFNTMLIEQYQSEKIQKGYKPATINRLIATLSHMFTKAIEWDMVEEETLKRIRIVKLLPENNKRLCYLSKEECQTLLYNCDAHVKPIVITAMNTGMRQGKILNLKWDNVDLRHGFISLNQEQTKNAERKEIPINHTLRAALQGVTRRVDIAYVFYDNASGKPCRDAKRSFKAALKRSGITDFKFHDLRHTFASHLVMAGVDLTAVKELLGHKDIKMTLRYAHLAPSRKLKAVDMLDETLTGIPTAQKVHNLAVNG